MTLLKIVMIAFILLELSNVVALYFAPGSKRANSVGVFKAWEQSKQYPEIHEFVKYLVNWIAGSKLIFLLLLIVIILFGDMNLQRLSLAALALATSTFYWRLFPLIKKMDRNGQIEPKNYSMALAIMIFIFVGVFILAIFI
ncbi:MAG: hypothetical protein RBS68_00995 [Anaerolineales bacterium]|jgi:hypothetical protein|nr:hypothetical protein [Anaerolineales bacterium]